jgi:hypothetical protein
MMAGRRPNDTSAQAARQWGHAIHLGNIKAIFQKVNAGKIELAIPSDVALGKLASQIATLRYRAKYHQTNEAALDNAKELAATSFGIAADNIRLLLPSALTTPPLPRDTWDVLDDATTTRLNEIFKLAREFQHDDAFITTKSRLARSGIIGIVHWEECIWELYDACKIALETVPSNRQPPLGVSDNGPMVRFLEALIPRITAQRIKRSTIATWLKNNPRPGGRPG